MEHDRRWNGSAEARSADHGGPERQIALFGEAGFTTEPRAEERGSKSLTNEERFQLLENPEVYDEFVRLAREADVRAGGRP